VLDVGPASSLAMGLRRPYFYGVKFVTKESNRSPERTDLYYDTAMLLLLLPGALKMVIWIETGNENSFDSFVNFRVGDLDSSNS